MAFILLHMLDFMGQESQARRGVGVIQIRTAEVNRAPQCDSSDLGACEALAAQESGH